MKSQTINLIKQALLSCDNDKYSIAVKNYLIIALGEAEKALKKSRASTPLQQMAQKGMDEHNKWWAQIQENVKKQINVTGKEFGESSGSDTFAF